MNIRARRPAATNGDRRQLTLNPKHGKSPPERSFVMRGLLMAFLAIQSAGFDAGRAPARALTKTTAKTTTKTV
jgi:hypothetical protein